MTTDSRHKNRVFVIGIGMTNFIKPGSRGDDYDYPDMVKEAVSQAVADAHVTYEDIEQAAVGYIYGPTCCGQRALYPLGMTGIPIVNVNNACASGSSAVFLMKQAIESGSCNLALATGFEKMVIGSLENMPGQFHDRVNPLDKHVSVVSDSYGFEASPMTAQMFGNAGREHMEKYGTKPEHFAKIGWKNHKHSVNNSRAQFQKEYSLDQVKNSRMIHEPLTLLQCSPTSDGAAAVVLCSEDYLRNHPQLRDQAVEILGIVLGTDLPSAFKDNSNMKMVGYDAAKKAAHKLYHETGLGPNDIQLIECHDCFSANELITYEALGLCPEGKAGDLIDRGDNTYGGKWVVNPSGGLISKGHPIGATGVAQVVEISTHLRGKAGKRQVPNARVGLQHNIGIGGAVVLGMYKLAYPKYPQTGTTLAPSTGGSGFKSDVIFEQIRQRGEKEGADLIRRIAASYRFHVTNGPNGAKKAWTIDCKTTPFFCGQREGKVDCEITISDENMMAIAEGKLKPDQAFMSGKMKLKGNMGKAMKLREVLDAAKLRAKL
jgi:sterol carrier protein 2